MARAESFITWTTFEITFCFISCEFFILTNVLFNLKSQNSKIIWSWTWLSKFGISNFFDFFEDSLNSFNLFVISFDSEENWAHFKGHDSLIFERCWAPIIKGMNSSEIKQQGIKLLFFGVESKIINRIFSDFTFSIKFFSHSFNWDEVFRDSWDRIIFEDLDLFGFWNWLMEVDFFILDDNSTHSQISFQKAFLISKLNPAISTEIILLNWLWYSDIFEPFQLSCNLIDVESRDAFGDTLGKQCPCVGVKPKIGTLCDVNRLVDTDFNSLWWYQRVYWIFIVFIVVFRQCITDICLI